MENREKSGGRIKREQKEREKEREKEIERKGNREKECWTIVGAVVIYLIIHHHWLLKYFNMKVREIVVAKAA